MTWITGLPGAASKGMRARKCGNRTRLLMALDAKKPTNHGAYYAVDPIFRVIVWHDTEGRYRGSCKTLVSAVEVNFKRKSELAQWLKEIFT